MTSILGDLGRTPDLFEPIIGWRAWQVQSVNGHHTLCSPQMGTPWTSGKLTASTLCHCGASKQAEQGSFFDTYDDLLDDMDMWDDDEIEGISVEEIRASLVNTHGHVADRGQAVIRSIAEGLCACGVNAFADLELLLASPYAEGPDIVIGQVALSGAVRCYERGYRAEHGQIMRVWAVDESVAQQARHIADHSGFAYAGTLDDLPELSS